MTRIPDLEDLNKRSERSITKMSDAQALAHIGELIDNAFKFILRSWHKASALSA